MDQKINLQYKTENEFFNPRRFFNLIKLDFFRIGNSLILAPFIVSLVQIILVLLNAVIAYYTGRFEPISLNYSFYFFADLFIGIISTSNILKPIHSNEKGISFYTLGASLFEKILSLWLYSFLFYYLFSYIAVFLSSFIVSLLSYLFFHISTTPSLLTDPLIYFENFSLYSLLTYLFIHSIFFLGSAIFKKLNFFYTILSIIVISICFNIVTGIFVKLVIPLDYFRYNIASLSNLLQNIIQFIMTHKYLPTLISIIFSILLYFVTYIRVNEQDLKGE
ncbi:MAG: hypothetical protein KBG82_05920 [Spirochaetes bacterium]|nr:hypothetical protein [Spirochaetota bacterium]MBP8991497.1 hypothetical protein [Spirochaetota bacterium]HNV43554.1 hypothetical protein [Exilispira sp.]HOV46975.1 hypothetical protein [Exilispira sp.]